MPTPGPSPPYVSCRTRRARPSRYLTTRCHGANLSFAEPRAAADDCHAARSYCLRHGRVCGGASWSVRPTMPGCSAGRSVPRSSAATSPSTAPASGPKPGFQRRGGHVGPRAVFTDRYPDLATVTEANSHDRATRPRIEYDFGVGWKHQLVAEDVLPAAGRSRPVCLAGRRACPPEDVGGPSGYAEPRFRSPSDWVSS